MSNFSVPTVGSIITVSTYFNSRVVGRSVADDTTTYENVSVLPNFSWTKPNEFCIPAENEPYITKRTISLSAVIDLIVHEGSSNSANSSGTKYVAVPGSKGKQYIVTVVDGFGTECECLGYTYRKQCKHLAMASDAKGIA